MSADGQERTTSLATITRGWTRIGVTGFGGPPAHPPRRGRFERLRGNAAARAFLDGAGPAAIGAIFGAAIPSAGAISETWQSVVLAAAALALLVLRRGIVTTLLLAGSAGAVVGLLGGPLPS